MLTDKNGAPLTAPDGRTLTVAERIAIRRAALEASKPATLRDAAQIATAILQQHGPDMAAQVAAQVLNQSLHTPNGLLSLLEARYGLTPAEGWPVVPPFQNRVPEEVTADAAVADGEIPDGPERPGV